MRQLIERISKTKNLINAARRFRQRLIYGHPWWSIYRRTLKHRSQMSLSKFAATFLRDGDIVIDVGANMGYTSTLMASCVEKLGIVYAFEPNPICFAKLEQSSKNAWHKNLHSYPFALYDNIGQITLQIDLREGSGASTIVAEHAERERTWHEAKYSAIVANTTTLDSFCEKSKIIPTFIKIDVEGAEDKVIRGGQNVITKHHPLIWFECWGGTDNGAQINHNLGHFKQLSDLGYNFFLATLFKLNDGWIHENNRINPEQLLRFEPKMLEHIPAMGCDILAATNDQIGLLHKCGLISEADAKNHILGFLKT